MPMAKVGEAEIFFDVTGHGSPVVVTAGQGSGPEARAELINGLARQHTVLSYDQRGTGRSTRGHQGQSMQELAGDIVALMDAAGFDRAHVIGISTGTGKATALAALHPSRVTRLVLAALWTHADPDLQRIQNLRIAAAQTLPPDHYVHLNTLLCYSTDFRRANFARFTQLAQDALAHPQDAPGIAARLNAILAFDARPFYSRIACPTLVMGARDDLIMPPWYAEEAAAAIPQCKLTLLDSGGHLFCETRTAEFLAQALPFLK